MKQKLLSIIIPVYNEETFVVLLLEKLLTIPFSTSGRETERIIINDGSKDSSEEKIYAFISDHPAQRIIYHTQPNSGK